MRIYCMFIPTSFLFDTLSIMHAKYLEKKSQNRAHKHNNASPVEHTYYILLLDMEKN